METAQAVYWMEDQRPLSAQKIGYIGDKVLGEDLVPPC